MLKSDRFKLETPLEEGDLGTLWRGNDPSSGAPLAVSILDADAPAEVRKLLEASAEALTTAKQASLPKVHAVQEDDDGGLNVAWEWIDGISLGERLAKRPALTVTELVRIVTEILDGLERVHAEGVAHGEVGPGRIVLSGRTERPRIIGFGLNHASFRAGLAETDDAAILASVAFASPEQARGESFASVSDDVWSIAATIYSAFTSSPPFAGSTLAELRETVGRAELASLEKVRPELKGALAETIDRALSKEKDKRYPDAAALRKALRASLLVWGRGALVRVGQQSSVVLPKAVSRSGAGSAKPSDGEWGPGESHSTGRGGAAPSEKTVSLEVPAPAKALGATPGAKAAENRLATPAKATVEGAKKGAATAAAPAKADAAKVDGEKASAESKAERSSPAVKAPGKITPPAKSDVMKPVPSKALGKTGAAAKPEVAKSAIAKPVTAADASDKDAVAKDAGAKAAAKDATSSKAAPSEASSKEATATAGASSPTAKTAASSETDGKADPAESRSSFEEIDASELESLRPPRPSVEELDASELESIRPPPPSAEDSSELEPARGSRASIELDSSEIEVVRPSDFPEAPESPKRTSERPKRTSERPKRTSDRPKRVSERPKRPSDRPRPPSRPPPKSLPARSGSARPPSIPPLEAAPRKRSLLVPITAFAIAVAVVLVVVWQLVPGNTDPVEPDVVTDAREPRPDPPEPLPPPEPTANPEVPPEPSPNPEMPPEPPAPRMVAFEGAPPDAVFFVGGRRVDPAEIEVPPEGTTRRLEVRARGFRSFRTELTSATERVAIELEAIEERPTQTAETRPTMRTTMTTMSVAMDATMTMRPTIVTSPGF